MVHRLVLMAFVGLPGDGQECRHLDGNPANNELVNLAWGTHKENEKDKYRHKTRRVGERHWKAKLSENDVLEIRSMYQGGMPIKEINEMFDIQDAHHIVHRKTWKHLKESVS